MKTLSLGPAARVGMAALLVAWLSMRSAQGLPRPDPVAEGVDPVANMMNAFAAAAPHLPENGEIAYISESDDIMPYFLAQHALIPRVLARNKERDIVVAYFPSGGENAEATRSLDLVADVGAGVRVYRRRSP